MKCPKCNSIKISIDDQSFEHEFGTEIKKVYYCEDCDFDGNEENFNDI